MNTLALDSSALISLSESCVISALRFLKAKAAFVAPDSVYLESVENPLKIKQYGFSALRIKRLFFEGAVRRVSASPEKTQAVLALANSLFYVGERPLELIHKGEADCLGLALAGVVGGIAVDEKTLKLLIENPNKLRDLLVGEYEEKVRIEETTLKKWQQLTRGIKIIRSAEILAIAGKLGYFRFFQDDEVPAFHAAIYALKGYGCSLTKDELKEFEQINFKGR